MTPGGLPNYRGLGPIRKEMKMRNLKELNNLIVADDGYAYSIILHVTTAPKEGKEETVGLTPYCVSFKKEKTGGFDNGPYPKDENKSVPYWHVESIMDYESLGFFEALKTQFSRLKNFRVDPEIMEEIPAACRDEIKKVRRRLEDRLRKMRECDVFYLAQEVGIKTDF